MVAQIMTQSAQMRGIIAVPFNLDFGGFASSFRDIRNIGLCGVVIRQLIVEDHVQQRLVHPNPAVVINETQLAEAIHKKAYTRSRGAYHLRQRLLRDLRYQDLRLARLAELRHQKEYSRQAFFTGIEQLIDKVRLNPHAARQQKR